MINYSVIQKSQLESALRIDAEYYQPEYLDIDKKILNFGKYYFFGELIEKFNSGKNWPQREDGKTKFIRTQHIKGILIRDEDDLTFCDKQPPRESLLLGSDLLFVRVGGVSDNSVASKDYEGHFYSDNVLRIRIKKLNPFFVSAFLNSYYGKSQLEKVMKGVAQPLISRENFEKLKIPNPSIEFQRQIEEIVLSAYDLRNKSLELYSKAEDLFFEELGLKDYQIKDELSYIVNLSDIKSVHRADAEYFQPKYNKLISKIKSQNAKLLGEIVSMEKGIEPGAEAYQDKGRLFIRVSSLSKYGVEDKDQKYLSEELYQKLKNNHEPKVGEILITKDATPGIAYMVKGQIEGIISSGILRLQVKDKEIENEYLTLCLNSVVGQMQAERDGGGSIITHWRPEQIKSVLIPILSKSTQQKIADLVQKSHEARSKAKQLLEQAKQKVEELIEK